MRINPPGITIRFIRMIEREDGSVYAQLPNHKTCDHQWVPLVALPADLRAAVLANVEDAYRAAVPTAR